MAIPGSKLRVEKKTYKQLKSLAERSNFEVTTPDGRNVKICGPADMSKTDFKQKVKEMCRHDYWRHRPERPETESLMFGSSKKEASVEFGPNGAMEAVEEIFRAWR